jgi:signal transduction histidine kinase
MSNKKLITLLFSFLMWNDLFCQQSPEQSATDYSPLRKANIDFLNFKTVYSNKDEIASFERSIFMAPDSLGHSDALLFSARRYIERSMPDKAISLLMRVIDSLPAGTDKSDYARINLCEAYRQKQEYVKGIGILDELLKRSTVSDENRAFAYNRLAALYNEREKPASSYKDSVFKYSRLCLDLAGKINSKPNLAASQNELCYQYIRKREFDKALELSRQAVANYKEAGMPFYAMSSLINQSTIFLEKKDYDHALEAIEEATDMSTIRENRNLYMRLYNQFALIYEKMGDYSEAYGFVKITYQLQQEFFKDRIDIQINELSAKYDLLVKEQKIKEAKDKTEYIRRQFIMLIIILAVLFISFILSVFYLRQKRKAVIRLKLIEAVVETETNERKRIARDLHDGLGPVLSAINHYFQAFLDAREEDKAMIRSKLQQVITDAIDEVSRISHNISPHVLENHGLITALNNFMVPILNTGKINVHFKPDFFDRFDLKKELTVYRCITELINNTLKHAEASRITIHIYHKENILFISYADNGKGFEISQNKTDGMGLYNIKNRVESFGGRLLIESSLKKGTKATIALPI